MYSGVLDDIDDALTCLSVSTPRSRLGSEFLFEDIEAIIRSSDHPPVGTTLPPLYPNGWNPEHTLSYSANPNQSGILNQKCGEPLRPGNIRKQGLKRLVNKPIRVLGDSGMVQRRCGDEQMLN